MDSSTRIIEAAGAAPARADAINARRDARVKAEAMALMRRHRWSGGAYVLTMISSYISSSLGHLPVEAWAEDYSPFARSRP